MPNTLERDLIADKITQQDEGRLALLGGSPAVTKAEGNLFSWPIVTAEDEATVLDVLRSGTMSQTEITQQFEAEFAAWQGSRHALGFNNGTSSLQAAMFGAGIGIGDEIICPSVTYWASILGCFSLGATVSFADIDPVSLCIDPNDIEHRITPETKAIVVVHYLAHPCDMDLILAIARRHNLKVIEDVSHAQGGLYKGRKLGTFGDVAGMSMMTGKSFAIGEAGMLVTDDREIYDRAIAWGHYERFNSSHIQTESLKPFHGLPLGGYKYRMHQLSSAMGRVQLKYYDERCAEIRRAMNYFWECLEDVPSLKPHRVDEGDGSNMAGHYHPIGHYRPELLGGLPVQRFVEALQAEGIPAKAGCNWPLHWHNVFNECDIYGEGSPTRVAHSANDVRIGQAFLPVSELVNNRTLTVPWFKHCRREQIEEYADAYRKVALNFEALLHEDQKGANEVPGAMNLSVR